jgi:hypothetical protein
MDYIFLWSQSLPKTSLLLLGTARIVDIDTLYKGLNWGGGMDNNKWEDFLSMIPSLAPLKSDRIYTVFIMKAGNT